MSKEKQPYIPFYLGDYIKDTRRLPLAVRGAWVDLLLFMWNEKNKGEITATYQEFSSMLGCPLNECEFAIGLLIEKNVCDHEFLGGGKVKLVSRRMKRDVKKSLIRSESGKKGVDAKKNIKQKITIKSNFAEAKDKQNTDIDYINDNEDECISLEGAGNFSFDSKTALPVFALEAAEMNQFTFTKNKNTDFVKAQWLIFLKERMNDPPEKKRTYRQIQDLTTYFLNWNRNKFPKNGATYQRGNSENGVIKETISTSGGFGKL